MRISEKWINGPNAPPEKVHGGSRGLDKNHPTNPCKIDQKLSLNLEYLLLPELSDPWCISKAT